MVFFVAEAESSEPCHFVTNEDPSQKLKWQAHLEFTQNQELGELTWDKVNRIAEFITIQTDFLFICYARPYVLNAPVNNSIICSPCIFICRKSPSI